jgi:acetyltransferase
MMAKMQIEELSPTQVPGYLAGLADLLKNAVESGASIGFLPPLAPGEATEYWNEVIAALDSGYRKLLIARENGRVIGAVQLDYASRRNASHRAEVMKLMVHTSARRRGLGRALMEEAARTAARDGRTLLVLDTRSGDPSEQLYQRLGYTTAGVIPGYARSASGDLHTTVIMFKHLL